MIYSSILALALATMNADSVTGGTLTSETPQIEKYVAEALSLPDPLKEFHITYDASTGFDHAIPLTASITYRGKEAEDMRLSIKEKGEAAVIEELKTGIKNSKRINALTLDLDRADGSVVANMTGVVEMNWFFRAETNRLSSDFINDVVIADVDTTIDPSWNDYDLVTLPSPSHRKMTQVIILPLGGEGFSIQGRDLNVIAANTEITRTLSLVDGRAIAITSSRLIDPEIMLLDLRAHVPILNALAGDLAFIIAPGGYKMSNEELETLKKQDLISPHAFNNRGYQYFHQGEFEKALADFRKASELVPEWTEPQAYESLSLLALEKVDEAEAALAQIDPAVGENDWVVQLAAGALELAKGDGDANLARDKITHSIALYPDNGMAYLYRAYAHARFGHYDRARADLEKTLEFDPGNYAALREMAYLDIWQDQNASALAMADKAIEYFPDSPDGYVLKANVLRFAGRQREARPLYERGLRLAIDGDTPGVWNGWDDVKWSALFGLDQPGRSLRYANAAIRKEPDNAKLLDIRCWIRGFAKTKLEKASEDCARAVALAPEDRTLAEGPGFILFQQGRFQEAVEALDAATLRAPLSSDVHFLRGLSKIRLNQTVDGEADIKKAKSLQYDVEEAYAILGITR